MNIKTEAHEFLDTAALAGSLVDTENPVQYRLFQAIGVFAYVAFPYTAYRLIRGLVKLAR